MNWTPEQLKSYYQRLKGGDATCPNSAEPAITRNLTLFTDLDVEQDHTNSARSSLVAPPRASGGAGLIRMNNTEAQYAQELENQRRLGYVLWWEFEGLKIRLANKTFFTPDFAVVVNKAGLDWVQRESRNDTYSVPTLEFHEVKGFWRDDARVKIKVAAELFPFKFLAVTKIKQKDGGGWKVEEFSGCYTQEPRAI